MNKETIQARISEIRGEYGDDGMQGFMEKKLMQEFIGFVGLTADSELSQMATEVLKSLDIDFARHYS